METIYINPPSVDQSQLPLLSDIQYLEPNGSNALNRKFCGVVRKGIFRGFSPTPATGMSVNLLFNQNPSGETVKSGVALVEREDYLLTVRQQHNINVVVPAGQKIYVVLEAFYQDGVKTKQVDANSDIDAAKILAVPLSEVLDHHVVICTVTTEADATQVLAGDIDLSERHLGGYDLESHVQASDPHPQYEKKDNAATDEDIDNESVANKHVKLPQFWRAVSPSVLVEKLWLRLAAKIFPVGAAIPWFTDVSPEGFGMMKGQAFDKLVFTELAKVFPDGIIPDMRGCGAVGKEDGETVGVFEEGQVKEHGHPDSSISSTDLGSKSTNTTGNHSHGIPYGTSNGPNGRYLDSAHSSYGYRYSTAGAGNHAHSVSIGAHIHDLVIALFGATKNTINHRKVNWIVRMA